MSFEHSKNTIKVGDKKIILDTELLEFNEASLASWQEKCGVYYSYYGEQLSYAEYLLSKYEEEAEVKYYEKFRAAKEGGCSDKLAEAQARSNLEVMEAQNNVIHAKLKVNLLKNYLKAFDKAHENAQSRNYMLRKEIDKLHARVPGDSLNKGLDPDIMAELDNIMKKGKIDVANVANE